MTDLARWSRLLQRLGLPPSEPEGTALINAWSRNDRHYHNLTHLADCLALLDRYRQEAERPDEVELALWFHDAIYKAFSSKNELRCAQWAQRFLAWHHVAQDSVDRVAHMILATRHREPPAFPDEALMLDIDLAILGAEPAAYDRYEQAIRVEYRLVPEAVYRRKRAEILEMFLQRAPLYHCAAIRAEREDNARQNLTNAIARLSSH